MFPQELKIQLNILRVRHARNCKLYQFKPQLSCLAKEKLLQSFFPLKRVKSNKYILSTVCNSLEITTVFQVQLLSLVKIKLLKFLFFSRKELRPTNTNEHFQKGPRLLICKGLVTTNLFKPQLSCLAKKKLLQFLFFLRKELRVDCKSGSLSMLGGGWARQQGVWAASGRWLSGYAGSSRPEALGQSSPPLSPPDDDDEHLHALHCRSHTAG